jgi:hypothetical protein
MAEIYWDTDEELGFVGRLATRPAARELLEGYLLGCSRRRTWGPIQRDRVVAKAEALLSEESRRADDDRES